MVVEPNGIGFQKRRPHLLEAHGFGRMAQMDRRDAINAAAHAMKRAKLLEGRHPQMKGSASGLASVVPSAAAATLPAEKISKNDRNDEVKTEKRRESGKDADRKPSRHRMGRRGNAQDSLAPIPERTEKDRRGHEVKPEALPSCRRISALEQHALLILFSVSIDNYYYCVNQTRLCRCVQTAPRRGAADKTSAAHPASGETLS